MTPVSGGPFTTISIPVKHFSSNIFKILLGDAEIYNLSRIFWDYPEVNQHGKPPIKGNIKWLFLSGRFQMPKLLALYLRLSLARLRSNLILRHIFNTYACTLHWYRAFCIFWAAGCCHGGVRRFYLGKYRPGTTQSYLLLFATSCRSYVCVFAHLNASVPDGHICQHSSFLPDIITISDTTRWRG